MGALQEIWRDVFSAHDGDRKGSIDGEKRSGIASRLKECFGATVSSPEAILLAVYVGGHSEFRPVSRESVGESALLIDRDALLYCRSQAFTCGGWSLRMPFDAIIRDEMVVSDERLVIPFYDEGREQKPEFGVVVPSRGKEFFFRRLRELFG
ncbi:hypothetical protein JXB02_06815 [Candidatus Woesearchaeota archaeon]|nr:hypothetical protein [Candidatus Woesearchaeota archaeon]